MKIFLTKRLRWLLWFSALTLYAFVVVFPLGNLLTRTLSVALLGTVWIGLIALTWRHRFLRIALLGFTGLCLAFFALPRQVPRDVPSLRNEYTAGLRRYEGRNYFWGGESPKGIDCSGLIRRGLIDALVLRGVRTLDAAMVREGISLWWHDCSARALGESYRGLTIHLLDTPSINALDHSQLLPGDLAVTDTGVHIMAYLGGDLWIEADPGASHVITVAVPSNDNLWFHGPMKIMRWSLLSDGI